MKPFSVHILAADHAFFEGECTSLILPTVDGQYGVLAGHSNAIGAIVPGTLTCRTAAGETLYAAVSAGLVKVEDGEVLVLVDAAERPEEIDKNRAERAAAAAKEALLQKRSIREYRLAEANLARAINRLRVKSHLANN